MALPQPRQTFRYCTALIAAAILCCALPACKHSQRVFKSDCDLDVNFKQVSFHQLMDSITDFDRQYVEVSGKYREDKDLSALFSDADHVADSDGLWVNFSQDCPLYLAGTHQGLFEYNDGQFTQLNNRYITIRGRIDLHNKGSHNKYTATIDRVSLVKL
ncbi:MAG: hypothetical protein JSU01_00240 [Bacteroidetes bacterium]|nr:hypothetical protein [Bacteroidota bacterium]